MSGTKATRQQKNFSLLNCQFTQKCYYRLWWLHRLEPHFEFPMENIISLKIVSHAKYLTEKNGKIT